MVITVWQHIKIVARKRVATTDDSIILPTVILAIAALNAIGALVA